MKKIDSHALTYFSYLNDKNLFETINKLLDSSSCFFDDKLNIYIVVGGDGTLINKIKQEALNEKQNLYYFINGGKLGYHSIDNLNNIDVLNNLKTFLNNVNLYTKRENLVKHDIYKLGNHLFVNDIHLSSSRLIKLKVKIDDSCFTVYCSGFIICTPFGSSGIYNSFNNNLLLGELNCLSVSFLGVMKSTYHGNGMPNFVLDITKYNLEIEIENNSDDCLFCIDGNDIVNDKITNKITIDKVDEFYLIKSVEKKFSIFDNIKKLL